MSSERKLLLLVTVLIAMITPSAASARPQSGKPNATLLVTGLEGASGSAIGPGGALYVTEGAAGRISRVDPQTGEITTFASGLPKAIIGIGGAIDVAFIGKTAYVLVTLVSPDVGGSDVDGIYRVDGPDSFTVVADIGAFNVANPPTIPFPIQVPSGLQYALQTYRGGFLVTDGHLNRVLRVTLDGEVSVLIAFDDIVRSLLLVDGADIRLAIVAAVAILIGNVLFGRRWLATGFDEIGGPASGEGWLEVVLLGLIALATTAALSVIGALLVAALFVAPAATVRLFANRMAAWQIGTVLLAAAEGTVGLWLSVKANAPPGATIATLSGAVFGVAAGVRAIGPRRLGLAAATGIAVALFAAGCGSSGSDSGKVSVVATTTQIGDFARQVGGNEVDVHQILSPNTDPHDYEPRPDDVTTTADAKIILTNGDNLDAWMDKVIDDSGSDARVVDLGAGVPMKLPGESSGPEASQYDPHWWHDPRNAEEAVRQIAAQLSEVDPAGKAAFEANAATYEAKLKDLDAGVASCIDGVPPAERKLVTDHDAFGYFAERYGIDVVGAVIPSQTTQAQPNAQDLSDLVDVVKREGVQAIFPESSLSPKLAETIASADRSQRRLHALRRHARPGRFNRRHLSAHGAGECGPDGQGVHRWPGGLSGERHWLICWRERTTWQPATARAPAIEDVTFEVEAGRRVALLGPNGGGKTTLLRVLLGELRPIRGTVEIRGRAAHCSPDRALAARLPRLRLRGRPDGRPPPPSVVAAPRPWGPRGRARRPRASRASPTARTKRSAISPAASASGC